MDIRRTEKNVYLKHLERNKNSFARKTISFADGINNMLFYIGLQLF